MSVEIDRDALIDACLAFVTAPCEPQRRVVLMGGPIPIDLLEVLAIEGVSDGRTSLGSWPYWTA